MRKEVETLLAQRDGESVKFTRFEADPDRRIPKELLGKKSDWRSLMKESLNPRDDTKWTREGDGISASGAGGRHVCELGKMEYGNCIVRARIRTEGRLTDVQLQLGDGAAIMLNWDAIYVWRTNGSTRRSVQDRLPANADVDLMIIRRGGKLEAWVDGFRAVEGAVDSAPHAVGIGFHSGGTVTFLDVRVRVFE